MTTACAHCGYAMRGGEPVCGNCGRPLATAPSGIEAAASGEGPRRGGRPSKSARTKRDKKRDLALIGTVVAGKYEVLDVLGQGGFGTVFMVKNLSLGDDKLAMKILPREFSSNSQLLDQFLHEIRVAMKLIDKYIVQIRDAGITESGLCYYTMDYVPGKSLSQLLREEGRLRPRRALRLIGRVLKALATVHRAGVVHRDLKPANVMIEERDGKEVPRVLDLGLATAAGSESGGRGRFVGSPYYVAPEQFGGAEVGPWTDLYSVGVVLYECLTGVRPYRGRTAREVYRKLKKGPPTPVESLAPHTKEYSGLKELVSKALERNPEKRFRSASAFFEQVAAVLAGGDVAATAPGRDAGAGPAAAESSEPGKLRRPGRGRRRARPFGRPSRMSPEAKNAVGLLALVVVAILGIYFLNKRFRPERESEAPSAEIVVDDTEADRAEPQKPPARSPEPPPEPPQKDHLKILRETLSAGLKATESRDWTKAVREADEILDIAEGRGRVNASVEPYLAAYRTAALMVRGKAQYELGRIYDDHRKFDGEGREGALQQFKDAIDALMGPPFEHFDIVRDAEEKLHLEPATLKLPLLLLECHDRSHAPTLSLAKVGKRLSAAWEKHRTDGPSAGRWAEDLEKLALKLADVLGKQGEKGQRLRTIAEAHRTDLRERQSIAGLYREEIEKPASRLKSALVGLVADAENARRSGDFSSAADSALRAVETEGNLLEYEILLRGGAEKNQCRIAMEFLLVESYSQLGQYTEAQRALGELRGHLGTLGVRAPEDIPCEPRVPVARLPAWLDYYDGRDSCLRGISADGRIDRRLLRRAESRLTAALEAIGEAPDGDRELFGLATAYLGRARVDLDDTMTFKALEGLLEPAEDNREPEVIKTQAEAYFQLAGKLRAMGFEKVKALTRRIAELKRIRAWLGDEHRRMVLLQKSDPETRKRIRQIADNQERARLEQAGLEETLMIEDGRKGGRHRRSELLEKAHARMNTLVETLEKRKDRQRRLLRDAYFLRGRISFARGDLHGHSVFFDKAREHLGEAREAVVEAIARRTLRQEIAAANLSDEAKSALLEETAESKALYQEKARRTRFQELAERFLDEQAAKALSDRLPGLACRAAPELHEYMAETDFRRGDRWLSSAGAQYELAARGYADAGKDVRARECALRAMGCQLRAHRAPEARQTLRSLRELLPRDIREPESPELDRRLADLYRKLDRLAEAAHHYRSACEKHLEESDAVECCLRAADAYFELWNYREASQLLTKAMQRFPGESRISDKAAEANKKLYR